jgi:chlorophyllide a reductase subunit Y
MSAPPARKPNSRAWTASGWKPGRACQFRASLEQDLAAMEEFKPDLAIGTTPVVQKAKERDPGALLHQPDLGAPADGPGRRRLAGAGGQCGIANKPRFDR